MAQSEAVAYGNAMHKALECVDYRQCDSAQSIRLQMEDLVLNGRMTAQQAELVDCESLASFFASPLGIQLRNAENVLREFKFSILDDGSSFAEGLEGEKILLQGVVDCAILEEDGITVIDFKTDRITEDQLDATVQNYRHQVEAYAEALSRIYRKTVKRMCLYFFRLNRIVDIE